MERRFRVRLDELLIDAEVCSGLLRGVMPRLEEFLQRSWQRCNPWSKRPMRSNTSRD